jgi:hypothetical protein
VQGSLYSCTWLSNLVGRHKNLSLGPTQNIRIPFEDDTGSG